MQKVQEQHFISSSSEYPAFYAKNCTSESLYKYLISYIYLTTPQLPATNTLTTTDANDTSNNNLPVYK